MRLYTENDYIREHKMDSTIGLELESHRITPEGLLAATPHPLPGHPNIDRDFSEDQVEINTPPKEDGEQVLAFLHDRLAEVHEKLKGRNELLWPFSNPPIIRREEEIQVAQYYGEAATSTTYRQYLARRYGKYLMTYSGIHFNYSFEDDLLQKNCALDGADNYRAYKDQFYLKLAEKTLEYSWVIVALLAASPLVDNSFYEEGEGGETVFTGAASLRCSERGYWNQFIPILSYEDLEHYVKSIRRYVNKGLLTAERELYYPVRLKSRGKYSMEGLLDRGVNHIELRMIDLNPFAEDGADVRDLEFLKLFLVWLASRRMDPLTPNEQVQAIQNYKNSSAYDWKRAHIMDRKGNSRCLEEALNQVLSEMQEFFAEDGQEIQSILRYELAKVQNPENRYAYRVRKTYGDDYIRKGLDLAKKKQEKF